MIKPDERNILQYDISDFEYIYYRRHLDLYQYDISVVSTSPEVYNGFTYSENSNLLYLVALDNETDTYVVLCISSSPGNSYLSRVISIPETVNGTYNISIKTAIMADSTVGDVLMIFNGESYSFWQIYKSTSFIFQPVSATNNTINQVI